MFGFVGRVVIFSLAIIGGKVVLDEILGWREQALQNNEPTKIPNL